MTAQLRRPQFLAIVASHVLASYLVRDPGTRPDGFVVEGPSARWPARRPEGFFAWTTMASPSTVLGTMSISTR